MVRLFLLGTQDYGALIWLTERGFRYSGGQISPCEKREGKQTPKIGRGSKELFGGGGKKKARVSCGKKISWRGNDIPKKEENILTFSRGNAYPEFEGF